MWPIVDETKHFNIPGQKKHLEVGTYTLSLFIVTETLQSWEERGQKYEQDRKQFNRTLWGCLCGVSVGVLWFVFSFFFFVCDCRGFFL